MGSSHTQTALLVLLFAALTILTLLAKALCRRTFAPPLVAYLLLGAGLGMLEMRWGVLGSQGREVLNFLATLGVIALLFRVGLESDLPGLLRQLRCATLIWAGNLLASAAAGYLAARWLLGFEPLASGVIAVAMTATSVGIPARIWQGADALDSTAGRRFLDVAELDDISGVVFMGILFAVLGALREGSDRSVLAASARSAGMFALKLAGFAAACVLFSRYLEKRYTRFLRRVESGPDPMLVVVGTGVLVAAAAGLLGFSVAIGAFFAGLVFSRDPQSVKVDASFAPLYDLFTPFFFIGVGLAIDPAHLPAAAGVGAVLVVAAAGGKILGTTLPARLYSSWPEATALGVSMVPRAEITMLIMHRARSYGPAAATSEAYAGMVVVSAVTCLAVPPVLDRLLRKRNRDGPL